MIFKIWFPLKRTVLLLLFVTLCLTACTHIQPPIEDRLLVRMSSIYAQRKQEAVSPDAAIESEKSNKTDQGSFKPVEPWVFDAGGKAGISFQKIPFSKTKKVSVSVDEMALVDFIHYVFSDIFDVNYVVDSKIEKSKEAITLNLEKISEYRLFSMVKDLLKPHEISIYAKDDIYYLMKTEDSKARVAAIGFGGSINDIPAAIGTIQQFIPIRYMDVRNLTNFLPLVRGARVLPYSSDNMMFVTGTREQIVQVIKLINVLDRPAMKGRHIGMLRLNYWDPAAMTAKLGEILTQEGIPLSRGPGKGGVYFNTLKRWSTIIFFASAKEWIERIRYWVKILDVPIEKDEKQFFLYFPQNSKASELGESLEKILGLTEHETSTEAGAKTGAVAEKKGKEKEKAREAAIKGIGAIGAVASDLKIAVDENRNALIIYATPVQYQKLESLLQRLDIIPVQVLIEATIAEVTLTDTLQYGVEWFLKNTGGSQVNTIQTLGGLGLGAGGLDFSLIADSELFEIMLNALAQEDLVKILQSPRITVRDGKTASIVVGTDVPVITSEAASSAVSVDGTSGTIQSVEYRTTGTTLSVTPSVHAAGIVTLVINQVVSEAQSNTTSDISSPMILNRSLLTEVVAGDGQTVLLGGLIKENESQTVTKIPILGSIPVLGNIFKTTSTGFNRTELIIMITPHIIRNTQQIDEMREAIFESFEHIGIEE